MVYNGNAVNVKGTTACDIEIETMSVASITTASLALHEILVQSALLTVNHPDEQEAGYDEEVHVILIDRKLITSE